MVELTSAVGTAWVLSTASRNSSLSRMNQKAAAFGPLQFGVDYDCFDCWLQSSISEFSWYLRSHLYLLRWHFIVCGVKRDQNAPNTCKRHDLPHSRHSECRGSNQLYQCSLRDCHQHNISPHNKQRILAVHGHGRYMDVSNRSTGRRWW